MINNSNNNLTEKVSAIVKQFGLDYQIAYFKERSYPLFYGNNLLQHLGSIFQEMYAKKRVLIVSHPELQDLFGEQTEKSLIDKGYVVNWAIFTSGELHKNLETLSNLYNASAKFGIDKSSAVIAFGGGVVQDVSNFLAATYMRGVPFIQIPTTLLSQADIGMGGCAINHPAGKSIIGQFYQPTMVVMDLNLLKYLPKLEITNGLAEIINKVVCLGGLKNKDIISDLLKIKCGDFEILQEYIKLSNQVKLKIIEEDEIGTKGTRFLLDWGHTITYALEKIFNYSISHGEALGMGMHGAAILSYQLGYLDKTKVDELKNIIESAGLFVKLPTGIKFDTLINYMSVDQKAINGQKRFVLLKEFGDAFVSEYIPDEQIFNCLKSCV